MIGETISHYRVIEQLGAGGMGVVYRAHDVRLGRDVALKFLPSRLARDRDALARFDREARLASSLNHPHICTLHDLDEYQGQPFIVMELYRGRTVKDLVGNGPLPVIQAVDIALQTAEALDAAHRRGIVHRDIKPANLFVTADGPVKVLDFGLAKLADPGPTSGPGLMDGSSPTPALPEALTSPGMAVGTVDYMSPEQAMGREVDARTDLFSLGAVLYEMVTGQRAFSGTTLALVFDGILNRQPTPARQVNRAVPPALDALIARALSKDPGGRQESAAELVAELREVKRTIAAAGSGPLADVPTGPRAGAATTRPRWWPAAALALAGLLAAVTVVLVVKAPWRGPPPLSGRDPVLLAGFLNQTGEAVFDGTLSQALAVQLSQSPYLNIASEDRVRETLRTMERAPDERPTGEVARELCQRMGLKAMVGGSIARLGRLYVVLVEATNCQTGASLAREQGQASSPEEVLPAIGAMSSRLRSRLGESLRSVQQFDVPIAQATTPSLEALKAYALGLAQRARGAEVESIPFFERALDLDPAFAAAATTLSTVYGNLGEGSKAVEYARLAYDSRERVSERERLFVTYQYHDRVTGDQQQSADTLEVWSQTYPNDFRPANALALLFNRLGRYDRGVEQGLEALRRSPGHPFPLSNLAHAYRGLGRYADAKRVATEAVTMGVATVPTRRLLYQLAVIDGNAAEAARQLAWARGKPREFDLTAAEAQVAAYDGRLGAADDLYRTTAELADRRGLPEAGGAYLAHQALAHVLYGNPARALTLARDALARSPEDESTASALPRFRAVATLGLAGGAEVGAIIREVERRYPESTFARSVLLPTTRAAIALHSGRPAAAVEELRTALAYETGTVAVLVPAYLRGEAYRRHGQGPQALAEYEKILRHRGADPFSPVVALARLGIARAWHLAGDTAKSGQAYQAFFAAWQRADPDVPVLIEARAEFERLESAP